MNQQDYLKSRLKSIKLGREAYKMKEVKVFEEDIQEAYKNGCEDAKKILRDLYPGLKLGEEKKEEFYEAIELKAHVSSSSRVSI